MRRAGTTLEDEQRRHARLIARLGAARPRRVQYTIDLLAELWSEPAYLHTCLGGYVHWQVRPSATDLQVVASFAADAAPAIRRATFAALQHAGDTAATLLATFDRGLGDPDAMVRLFAARIVHSLGLGSELLDALAGRLCDPVWSVRWHAAAALAGTPAAGAARDALASSRPERGPALEVWEACSRDLDLRSAGRAHQHDRDVVR